MVKKILLINLILLLYFFVYISHAEIYVYVDKKGVYHYTNTPTSSKYKPFSSKTTIASVNEKKIYKSKKQRTKENTEPYISAKSQEYGTLYVRMSGDQKGTYKINSQSGSVYRSSKKETVYYTNYGSYVLASENSGPYYKKHNLFDNSSVFFSSPNKYEKFIKNACYNFGLDPSLVKAVIHAESAGNYKAVSPKGALGLMQLMPGTARDMDVADPLDPEDNIYGGSRYLKEMIERFDGDIKLALAAYNAGPGAVEKNNGIPPYQETQQYVKKVISLWKQYKIDANSLN